jgi:uncharacterized protein DUF4260
LEGASLFALAAYFYHVGHFRWWMFAILFLWPDLFMLGYLINVKWESALYNLAHTITGPAVLLLVCYLAALHQLLPFALIWLAHIGFDRALGYGLKYPTHFKDTHLQRV